MTVTLQEALERAKPGTLKSRVYNRAVLKHCFNKLPPLVEALDQVLRGTACRFHYVGEECPMCKLREILESAKTVELPSS